MSHLLVQGDARRLPLADGSVDAIVTDPPYGQTNEGYDSDVACRPEVWRECFRVAKPNAALVSFAGSPTYHRIAGAIEAAGWRVRQMWGWVYPDGMMTSAWPKEGFDRLSPAMDPIVYATKGKVLLQLEREGRPWSNWASRNGNRYSDRARHVSEVVRQDGHWPRSVVSEDLAGWHHFMGPRSHLTRGESVGHPNQKPLGLMEWIISKLPGELILDPFAGSATTVAAANALGRRAIGCDLSREYLDLARRRIERPHVPVPRPSRPDGDDLPLFAGAGS